MKHKTSRFLIVSLLSAVLTAFAAIAQEPASPRDDIRISNQAATLTLGADGTVKSLLLGKKELLATSEAPLSTIVFADGTQARSTRITSRDDVLEVGYDDPGGLATLVLEIRGEGDSFLFTVKEASGHESWQRVTLFELKPKHIAQQRDPAGRQWALAAGPDEPFLHALPINDLTVCMVHEPPAFAYKGYKCQTGSGLRVLDAAGALVTTTKESYNDTLRHLVETFRLPDVRHRSGDWLRAADRKGDSYLFAAVTHANHEDLLSYAQRGGFERFLMQDAVIPGLYAEPPWGRFEDEDQFYQDMDHLREAGMRLGLHTVFGYVDTRDSFFGDLGPDKPGIRFGGLLQVSVGTVENQEADISTITLAEDLESSDLFARYREYGPAADSLYFYINAEILRCRVSGRQLTACRRGEFRTEPTLHESGDDVKILPFRGRFLINFANKVVQRMSVGAFSGAAERLGIDFVYADGTSYITPSEVAVEHLPTYVANAAIFPFLWSLESSSELETAGDGFGFRWYHRTHANSWQGAVFHDKAFTRDFKVSLMQTNNPYASTSFHLGWWKLHGSFASTPQTSTFDYDASTLDDVHYVMTKVAAFDSFLGLQLDTSAADHAGLGELFDLTGLYHRAIRDGIPPAIRDDLQDPYHEAELRESTAGTRQFVKKSVERHYAAWNKDKSFMAEINNPFAAQSPRVEIRPRFDYKGFDHEENLLISDFTKTAGVLASSDGVECSLSGQNLRVLNTTKRVGGCRIDLGTGMSLDLTGKRGLGLEVTGDGSGAVLVAHLSHAGPGTRDYRLPVDFNGRRILILGDPTTDLSDPVGGWVDAVNSDWQFSRLVRSLAFDWSSPAEASLFVFVKPNAGGAAKPTVLTLHRFKALQEKGENKLKNPTLTLGPWRVTFPVTLSTAIAAETPNIVEYDGRTGSYRVLTANHVLLATGEAGPWVAVSGKNTLEMSSEVTSRTTWRAELRVTVDDDEDGDGVATNGDFTDAYKPCRGANASYCDDNCAAVANTDQADQDGDGVGDACEG